jgi:hypothetical protein
MLPPPARKIHPSMVAVQPRGLAAPAVAALFRLRA